MMEAEMDEHLGYEKSQRSNSDDARNGYKQKQVNSSYGPVTIDVPQDRKSTFQPQVVKKRQKDISEIDQKIISIFHVCQRNDNASDLGYTHGYLRFRSFRRLYF